MQGKSRCRCQGKRVTWQAEVMNAPNLMLLVKFSDLEEGDLFMDDGITYEKRSDKTAYGPKSPLGVGVFDFCEDDLVERA
jgi:hypothetical protein